MDTQDQPTIISANLPNSSSSEHILTAARGGGILLFGYLFEYVGRFIFGILVARSIGASGYGLSVLGATVATTLATIARLGLSEGIVHFLPGALRERNHARIWDLLQVGLALPSAIGLGLGVMVFLSSGFLAEKLFHEPAIVPILHWASLAIPLIALGYALMSATRGFMRMEYHMFAENVVLNLGKIFLTLLFLYMGLGATGVMAAYAIIWIFVVGLMFYFLNRLYSLRRTPHFSSQSVRELISFSAPVCLTQLISQFNGNFELLLLGMLGTLTSVGIYSGALRIQVVGVMFLLAIEMVAKPLISDLFHGNDIYQMGRLYKTLTRWCLSFILPYFFTIVLFASPILSIFGEEFRQGAPTLIILSIGMLVNAGTGICGAMIIMTGHSRLEFFNITAALIVNTTLNVLLIPIWGMFGAAIGTALTISAVNIARLIQVHKLLRLWPYDQKIFKPFFASAMALVLCLMASRFFPPAQNIFSLLLDIAVLWISCAAATLLLGLSAEDRMLLSHAGRRLSTLRHRDRALSR